jgi:hypothetical protein
VSFHDPSFATIGVVLYREDRENISVNLDLIADLDSDSQAKVLALLRGITFDAANFRSHGSPHINLTRRLLRPTTPA